MGSFIGFLKSVLEKNAENAQLGGNGYKGWGTTMSKIVPSLIQKKIGLDECWLCVTGAAPMPEHVQRYLASVGFNITEGYGMSEMCAASTCTRLDCYQWGSIGYPIRGVEVQVFNDKNEIVPRYPTKYEGGNIPEEYQGEIRSRGRNTMMGYMANPKLGEEHVAEITQKNLDCIADYGWVCSGDKGVCSERGMFKITGRYKELIITAGGENIAPVPIEDSVKSLYPGISNFLMVGDKRPYNVALVTLLTEGYNGDSSGTGILDAAVTKGLKLEKEYKTVQDVLADDSNPIIKKIEQCIIEVNKTAPNNAMTIKKFTILAQDLSIEDGDLTPTLKTKRSVINKKLADKIETIYGAPREATYVKTN